jgi:hypothetical protein
VRQGLNEQAENIDVWSVLLHQAVVAWLGSEKLKSPVDVSSRRAFHNSGTWTSQVCDSEGLDSAQVLLKE